MAHTAEKLASLSASQRRHAELLVHKGKHLL
jgi:hypothetical protein